MQSCKNHNFKSHLMSETLTLVSFFSESKMILQATISRPHFLGSHAQAEGEKREGIEEEEFDLI